MPEETPANLALTKNATHPALERLAIVKDIPLFGGVSDNPHLDAFDHSAFATAIFTLLQDNDPPLSIGLFGAWGIGKSTVLNILKNKVERSPSANLKYIYFNAWKYSGDSFRRQFLIEIARGLHGDEHEEVKRLQELNFNAVIKQSQQKQFLTAIADAFEDAIKLQMSLKSVGILRFLLGLFGIAVTVGLGISLSKVSPALGSIVSASGISAVFLWFSNLKFEDLFVVQETPIYDPKLVFPEQFEFEFRRLISGLALKGQRAVIAIDDIDRCEASVIRDVLTSSKNFLGEQNCFFIIPCDEKTVVDVFKTDADQASGYKDESLRKYFNVALRIPPIPSSDLVDFANSVVAETGLPDRVVQIAILANCRDARKMKYFLNSLKMKYQVAKAREANNLMPAVVDDNIEELAKAVLIEDAFPELYALLVENPRLYELLNTYALSGLPDDDGELKRKFIPLPWWEKSWPAIREILFATRDVKMPHANVLFALKSSNIQSRIPRGIELDLAVLQGNIVVVREILKTVGSPLEKTAVADLLLEKLRQNSAIFLQNSIASALVAGEIPGFLPETKRRQIGEKVISAITTSAGQKALVHPVSRTLQVAQEFSPNRLDELLSQYIDEFKQLEDGRFPNDVVDIVQALYTIKSWRSRLVELINRKFLNWIDTDPGLNALASLKMPIDVEEGERIPSQQLASAAFLGIRTSLNEMSANAVRRHIGYSNWHPDFAAPFIKSLEQVLASSSASSYSPELSFMTDSILQKPELLGSEEDHAALWTIFSATTARLEGREGLDRNVQVISIFAAYSRNANVRASAESRLAEYWQTMSDPEVRDHLQFLSATVEIYEPLRRQLLANQFQLLKSERLTMGSRSIERLKLCADFKSIVGEEEIEQLIVDGIGIASDKAGEIWTQQAEILMNDLSASFPTSLCASVLTLAPSIPSQDRLRRLLGLFTKAIYFAQSPEDANYLKSYFKLFRDPDTSLRNVASESLEPLQSVKDDLRPFFRMATEELLHEVANLSEDQISEYKMTLDALIQLPPALNDRASDLLLWIAKRFLGTGNLEQQIYGLSIIERSSVIRGEYVNDNVHLLINLAQSHQDLESRVIEPMSRLMPKASGEAREKGDQYLEGKPKS